MHEACYLTHRFVLRKHSAPERGKWNKITLEMGCSCLDTHCGLFLYLLSWLGFVKTPSEGGGQHFFGSWVGATPPPRGGIWAPSSFFSLAPPILANPLYSSVFTWKHHNTDALQAKPLIFSHALALPNHLLPPQPEWAGQLLASPAWRACATWCRTAFLTDAAPLPSRVASPLTV